MKRIYSSAPMRRARKQKARHIKRAARAMKEKARRKQVVLKKRKAQL